jgi:hypothetical protein
MTTETRTPVPRLSHDVVNCLWLLALLDLTFGAWILAVTHGAAACEGLPCTVAVLGDHPVAALVLSQVSALLLVVLLPLDHAAMGRARLAAIGVAALGGLVALAGVAMLVAVVALVLVVATAVVVHVVDKF